MKAQFFNKPLSFNLDVAGDSWEQGSSVKGNLTISNTSSQSIYLTLFGCHLCYCQTKKLKAKDPSGIQIIKSFQILPGQDKLAFDFSLDPNCPITDNAGSMQILTGNIEDPMNCGMLELKIIPLKVISSFIEVFESFYRFKFKALKNKKGFIEAQLTPPATKEWTKIQKMNIRMKMNGENLIVTGIISIKSLSFETSASKTKDEKKEIILNITKKEHSIYGSVNQDGIKKHISQMLDQVKLKPIM